ncbi:hypothetical protein [Streptomyces sp. NPDC002952]|uniref:hypothetical protein n=1 Tax=Streptomyces sp. NPDC002952 TaxID=3364673 RepID=UPI0036A0703B
MTDTSQPASARRDLSSLIPTVAAVEGADPELVAIGERYWAMAGFHPELGTPVWCEKAADIDSLGWGKPLYVVAAAGVRAVVADFSCDACAGPLSLTSRTALEGLCNGVIPPCVTCTDSLQTALKAVLDPGRRAKRDSARKKAQEQQAVRAARDAWEAAQREVIAADYAFRFRTEPRPTGGVREMVAALALLRYAPDIARIRVVDWLSPLHPDERKLADLCGDLVRSELIAIHPESPVNAIVWAPKSFEAALDAADGDLEAVARPQDDGQFYPTRAQYYAPYGTSPGTGATYLDAFLSQVLAPERLTAAQQDDLVALALELLTAESVRYFLNRLEEVNLPTITDNHRQRLEDAARKAAGQRSLGEIYNLVWRSTRAAAEAAQKNPRAPRVNMSTHAVNQFESHAHHAATDSKWEIKAFSEVPACPLAAMTRTLLYTVLDQTPVETSLPQISDSLPEPISVPEPPPVVRGDDLNEDDLGELAQMLMWLAANPDTWDVDAVSRALEALQRPHPDASWNVDVRVLQRASGRLQQLHAHLLPLLGPRQTALAVLAASSDLLTHPTTDPQASDTTVPVGSVICNVMTAEIFKEDIDDLDEEA